MLRMHSPRLNVTCSFRQKTNKQRPSGAEKSSEPSLILAGERLNDRSCLDLQTWCQADANLLAGDVLLCCPCYSHTTFSIQLHFYCCCHQQPLFFIYLFLSKWLSWLAIQVCVCVCLSKNESGVLVA